VSTN